MPSFQDDHKGLKRLLLQKTMASPQRETWRLLLEKQTLVLKETMAGNCCYGFEQSVRSGGTNVVKYFPIIQAAQNFKTAKIS